MHRYNEQSLQILQQKFEKDTAKAAENDTSKASPLSNSRLISMTGAHAKKVFSARVKNKISELSIVMSKTKQICFFNQKKAAYN